MSWGIGVYEWGYGWRPPAAEVRAAGPAQLKAQAGLRHSKEPPARAGGTPMRSIFGVPVARDSFPSPPPAAGARAGPRKPKLRQA